MRYPGGIHLAGGDVGDVVAEGDGDVAGRLVGAAQVDGDVGRDDDRRQDAGVACRGVGRGAASAAAGKEEVGRDDHRRVLLHDAGVGGGHFQVGQGGLAGKDLHALDADGTVAWLFGHQVADRVGLFGGVVLVQREAARRGLDLDVGGQAVFPGDAADSKAFPRDGDADAGHGGGPAGGVAVDAQNSCCHSGCSFAL